MGGVCLAAWRGWSPWRKITAWGGRRHWYVLPSIVRLKDGCRNESEVGYVVLPRRFDVRVRRRIAWMTLSCTPSSYGFVVRPRLNPCQAIFFLANTGIMSRRVKLAMDR